MKYVYGVVCLLVGMSLPMTSDAFRPDQGDGWGPTAFSNVEGISNTRHNLSLPEGVVTWRSFMDGKFNNYEAVCVYCHTPHGANPTTQGTPLWNRPTQTTTYTLYSGAMASGQNVSDPGPNSITCLSCHDGTLAIDAIINMPGRGGYDPTLQAENEFLDQWSTTDHQKMGDCAWCHYAGNGWDIPDFNAYTMGSDLRDDHPIGVELPEHMDFRVPSGIVADKMIFFDTNGNERPDKNEVRLYNSGEGFEVECASCHDPHGVMSPGYDTFNPGFLRTNNAQSAVCYTCHIK